jgi:hypothetical protein
VFAFGGCHSSDNVGGAGGSLGTGGALAVGGAGGSTNSGSGGLSAPAYDAAGIPPEWGDASVEAGVDCMTDHSVCGPDAFCGIVQLNGNYAEHYCFSKGNCQSCQCLADTLSAFYNRPFNETHMASSVGSQCCAAPDAAASSTVVVECDGG